MNLPIGSNVAHGVEEQHAREISAAIAELQESKYIRKKAQQIYLIRVKSAKVNRTHRLAKTCRDNCNNWDLNTARLRCVIHNVYKSTPVDKLEDLAKDASHAETLAAR